MAKIDESTIAITKRFGEALDALIVREDIKNKLTFANKYDIDYSNLNATLKDPEKASVRMTWLAILVKDYAVSGRWILTGLGEMFGKE